MKNKVSFLIIVPTLNSHKELRKLFVSLKVQTYKNWRTIFIDGDSNLEHKQWVQSCCSDSRFLLIEENKNARGIYPAMSQGVENIIDEEWVIFLGSDDWFNSPFALENIANKIFCKKKIKKFNLLMYGTQFVQKNNKKILRINNIPSSFMRNIGIYKMMFFGYMPTHHSVCFSSKVIKKFMPYNNNYKLAADNDLFLRLFKSNSLKIGFINDILINIQAGGTSSKSTFTRLKEVVSIYYKNYSFIFFVPFFARYLSKIIIKLSKL